MRGLGKIAGILLSLAGGLTPTMALAHCCCDHASRPRQQDSYWAERPLRWDEGYAATAGRACSNYPASALRARASGVTRLAIRVGDNGRVVAVRISGSSGRADLDRAALACVRGWRLGAGYDWRMVRVTWRYHGPSWG